MEAHALEGGFADQPIDAAHAFRAIMDAMARPGITRDVTGATPPAPLSQAAGVVLLTLCDPDTPVYLAPSYDTKDLRDWIAFHTNAPISGPQEAQFALGRWDELPLNAFSIGVSEYPDRSATLIVETGGTDLVTAELKGPGIKDTHALDLPEIEAFQNNALLFPLGLDFIFTSGAQVAALPRTTKVRPCM